MELWGELNSATWKPVIPLGSNWLGKWISSNKGYSLIITDGIDMWGEQRNESYIIEKSQEWAACLIAGVEELCTLFLSRMGEEKSDIRLSFESRKSITVDLQGDLEGLPYSWLFYLDSLPKDIIEHHWTFPIATTMEFMSAKIIKLEEELKKKSRQLEEFSNKKENDVISSIAIIDPSIQKVFFDGIGKIMSSQLSYSSILINKMVEKKKLCKNMKTTVPHNRPKLKKSAKGSQFEESPEKQKADEATRRAQIQSLTQTTIIPVKKKKKLNI